MIKPELLAPAGDFEKLKVAFHFGADAVYVGLKEFSLRANTKNFGEDEIREAIKYSHSLGKRIYLTLNIYFTPEQADGFIENLKIIENLKPDGIIISDMGALNLAKKYAPGIPIHISTQANTTNQYSVETYKSLGASRIVLARELSLKHIEMIKKSVSNIELEAFIHGAMCIAYSGRCLLSAYMTKNGLGMRSIDKEEKVRSANQGDCSHSCRWEYILKEKTRADQNYEIVEDEVGSYVFSSKDICMIDHIGDMIQSGITSFKIEGRMKSNLYISSIVRAYRQAIDHYFDETVSYDRNQIENELNVVSHREFSTGFFYDNPIENVNVTVTPVYKRETRLAALIEDIRGNKAVLKIYNTINPDEKIEYISKNMKTYQVGKIIFYSKEGYLLPKVNHTQYVEAEIYDLENNRISLEKLDILRMESNF
jgi:U32 family peptidase